MDTVSSRAVYILQPRTLNDPKRFQQRPLQRSRSIHLPKTTLLHTFKCFNRRKQSPLPYSASRTTTKQNVYTWIGVAMQFSELIEDCTDAILEIMWHRITSFENTYNKADIQGKTKLFLYRVPLGCEGERLGIPCPCEELQEPPQMQKPPYSTKSICIYSWA